MDDRLLEPLEAYRQSYEREFARNTQEYFDDLVRRSGMDEAANQASVRAYEALMKDTKYFARKQKNRLMRYRLLLVFVALAALLFYVRGERLFPNLIEDVLVAIKLIVFYGTIGFSVFFCLKVIHPMNRRTKEKKQELEEKAKAILEEARGQMEPLNALFDGDATRRLIEKTVPLLKIDERFSMRRYDYLSGKYGFGASSDPNRSVLGVLTGEILGNPFVVERQLVHTLGVAQYTGERTISWTTHHVGPKGRYTKRHTETLTATIRRPKPYYSEQTRLIYGNEAAPDLHFTHNPSHAERLTEKELAHKVKAGAKEIRDRQRKALKKGELGFTEVGNEEFDVLFGALDRDHEVQFRLLFTPLAQKNMLALMKSKVAWGDDFLMRKEGCINVVSSEHSGSWDMNTRYYRYLSHSVDQSRTEFTEFNCSYFKALYFDLAPLLAIPLYQQHKPKEYIYKENYPRNCTHHETECLANALGAAIFAPSEAVTQTILKAELVAREGGSDRVRIVAHAYRAIARVELVPVLGGDGRIHDVPVPWTEYCPVEQEREVMLRELGLSDRAFEKAQKAGPLKEALLKHSAGAFTYRHGILCCVASQNSETFDADFAASIQ